MSETAHMINSSTHVLSENNWVLVLKNIRICALNVCGLYSKLELGILQKYINDYDFICLSETKNVIVDINLVEGYIAYSNKCTIKHGIQILVKKA